MRGGRDRGQEAILDGVVRKWHSSRGLKEVKREPGSLWVKPQGQREWQVPSLWWGNMSNNSKGAVEGQRDRDQKGRRGQDVVWWDWSDSTWEGTFAGSNEARNVVWAKLWIQSIILMGTFFPLQFQIQAR